MNIGCSTLTWRALPVEDSLKRIADAGFDVIDIVSVPTWCPHVEVIDPAPDQAEHLAALLKELGLRVAAINSVLWIPDAIDNPAEMRRRYEIAADVAAAVGSPLWIVDQGQPAADDKGGREGGIERWVRTVNMGAEIAADRGLRLIVETPHRGTLAESFADSVAMVERSGIPDLGVVCDTSHVLNSGATIPEYLHAYGPRIAHVQLRDGIRGGNYTTPGDGEFDFATLLAGLKRLGYDGEYILELEPPEEDLTPDQLAIEAIRGRDYLQGLAL